MTRSLDTTVPLSKLGTPHPHHPISLPFRPRFWTSQAPGAFPDDPVKNPISTGSPRPWMISKPQLWALSKRMEVIPELSLDAKRLIESDEHSEKSKKVLKR